MRWVAYLDDNEMLRQLVQELVESVLGVRCLTAGTLDDFKNIILSEPPVSLAILDINLGVAQPTGIDAFHWLRAQGMQEPIFFLTGYSESDPLVKDAGKLGVPIFEKPMQTKIFLERLRESLKLSSPPL